MKKDHIELEIPLVAISGIDSGESQQKYPDITFDFDSFNFDEPDFERDKKKLTVSRILIGLGGLADDERLADFFPPEPIAPFAFEYSNNRMRRIDRFLGAKVVGSYIGLENGELASRTEVVSTVSLKTVNAILENLRVNNHPIHQLAMQYFVKYGNSTKGISAFDIITDVVKQTLPSRYMEAFEEQLGLFVPLVGSLALKPKTTSSKQESKYHAVKPGLVKPKKHGEQRLNKTKKGSQVSDRKKSDGNGLPNVSNLNNGHTISKRLPRKIFPLSSKRFES